jgi:hypothetical protein
VDATQHARFQRGQRPRPLGLLEPGAAGEPLVCGDFPLGAPPLGVRVGLGLDEPPYPGLPLVPSGELGVVLFDLGEGNAGRGSAVAVSALVCGALGGQQAG